MHSSFDEAISFIRETHDKEITLGLGRVEELLGHLGEPQNDLKFIHVAGTNGKGSVCAMTAQILKEAGLRVGLFTSPVIIDYRELFKVNGEMISQEDFICIANQIEQACNNMQSFPSEFEKAVAMAFIYFKKMSCDLVVIEVGMGGDGDATNIIPTPEVAVIVNIDYDHTAFLGNTLTEIASKKAGIIKEGGDVVLAMQNSEVIDVVEAVCKQKGAELVITDHDSLFIKDFNLDGQMFDYKGYEDIQVSLLGEHQCENTAIVVEVIERLISKGYSISEDAVRTGLVNVSWPGRFEIMSRNPVVILDGAHNPHGINALQNNLRTYFPGRKFVFIVGILRDKNYVEMLKRMMVFADSIVTVTPPNPRALPADEMAATLLELGFERQVKVAESIGEGVWLAKEIAAEKTPICAFGSLYSIGELKKYMEG